MEEIGGRVLESVEEELVVFVDADPLMVGKKANFEPSLGEYGDADRSVRGFLDNSDTAQDGAEVGKVCAVAPGAVAECDVEAFLIPLWRKVKAGNYVRVGDADVRPTVHDARGVEY